MKTTKTKLVASSLLAGALMCGGQAWAGTTLVNFEVPVTVKNWPSAEAENTCQVQVQCQVYSSVNGGNNNHVEAAGASDWEPCSNAREGKSITVAIPSPSGSDPRAMAARVSGRTCTLKIKTPNESCNVTSSVVTCPHAVRFTGTEYVRSFRLQVP